MCPLTGIHLESRSSSLSVDKEAASPERDTFVDIDTSDLLVAILSHGDLHIVRRTPRTTGRDNIDSHVSILDTELYLF